MRRFLPLCFLLPTLLGARAGRAQVVGSPYRQPIRATLPEQTPPPAPRQPVWTTMGPTIPMSFDAAEGLLPTHPDSVRRRQYARHKVRAVLKVQLNAKGDVQDTLDYQAFDHQGRCTQQGPTPDHVRRQWTYNAQGQCTAVVEYPSAARPYTVIGTYNPALRRSQQEVLQSNGARTITNEKHVSQSGDTLLTEVMAHPLTLGYTIFPEYYQRSLRLQPHPDTVLSLTSFYNASQELTGTRADYSLYQHGRLTESGKLDLPADAQRPKLATGPAAPGYGPALRTLRHGPGRHAQLRRSYDARHRLIRQETLLGQAQESSTTLRYTYNSLDQLIGQEGTTSSVRTPTRTAYVVFSYLPNGLPLGETTDARTSKPVFYRYLYQYYP